MGRRKNGTVEHRANWDALDLAITKAGFTKTEISQIIGKQKNYLTDSKCKGRSLAENDLVTIAFITKVDDFHKFVYVPPSIDEPINEAINNYELVNMVEELDKKMNKIIELLAGLSMPKSDPIGGHDSEPKTRHDRAVGILRTLLDNEKGRTRKTEFIKQLMIQNIGSSYAEPAIKEIGANVAVVGYGNNKTTWIMKGDE